MAEGERRFLFSQYRNDPAAPCLSETMLGHINKVQRPNTSFSQCFYPPLHACLHMQVLGERQFYDKDSTLSMQLPRDTSAVVRLAIGTVSCSSFQGTLQYLIAKHTLVDAF